MEFCFLSLDNSFKLISFIFVGHGQVFACARRMFHFLFSQAECYHQCCLDAWQTSLGFMIPNNCQPTIINSALSRDSSWPWGTTPQRWSKIFFAGDTVRCGWHWHWPQHITVTAENYSQELGDLYERFLINSKIFLSWGRLGVNLTYFVEMIYKENWQLIRIH